MSIASARSVSLIAFLFLMLVGANPVQAQAPDTELTTPKSWTEFTSYLVDGGDLGWWEARGTTTDVWKTMPAGIDYHYRAHVHLDETGRQVIRTFTYVDADGKLISSGSETIVWDEKTGKVLWSISGLDGDRPWSDSGHLVGYDATRMVVASVEEAEGARYELRTTMERTGENRRRRTIARGDGKGTPLVQEYTRVNHLVDALSGWNPTGTWITDFGGMKIGSRATWSADRRCVVANEGPVAADGTIRSTGTSLMWFDLDRRTIRQKYIGSMGMTLDGEVVEVSKDLMVIRYTGTDAEGVALRAVVTMTRKDGVMTTQFSEMTYDGKAATPAWAMAPMTSTREQGGE